MDRVPGNSVRTDDGGGVQVVRRIPLSLESFPGIRGKELYVALAALQRIRALWESTTAGRWVTIDFGDDACDLYAELYRDTFWALESRTDLCNIATEIRTLVPDSLPDSDLALGMDDFISGKYRDDFSAARRKLVDALYAEGGVPWNNPAEPLFDIFDAEIETMRQYAVRAGDQFERRLGLEDVPATPRRVTREPDFTKEEIEKKATEFLDKNPRGKLEGPQGFLGYVGISKRTWSRYRKNYGMTWSSLKRDVRKTA